ncbi:MAG TPA: hypothetical protein VFJ14_15020 [Nocardioidaceae bacterium]|nr:hypothetical protein [Nocardioidaceae bacterium]
MTLVFVLLVLALVLACGGWYVSLAGRWQPVLAAGAATCLAVVGAAVWWGSGGHAWSDGHETLVALSGVLAVAGGGPATVAVFRLVDGELPTTDRDSVEAAGEVLRGGAWIGGLERAAVFATVVTGWPEGLAIILALKGVARYPELRGPGAPTGQGLVEAGVPHGVAERFIIGTFVSVLWAAACAGVALS